MAANQETLWDATNVIFAEADEYQVILTEEAKQTIRDTYMYGMRYNEVLRCDVPIEHLKGKFTSKWFHSVVTRLDNGRYEVVCYPL